jgi:hypothetical protein
MTFTSVLRNFIFDADKAVNTVVYSALFCCIAWGIADGAFYAWERNYIFRRENEIVAISKFPEKSESAVAMIRDELDDTILRTSTKRIGSDYIKNLCNIYLNLGVSKSYLPVMPSQLLLRLSLVQRWRQFWSLFHSF